MRVTPEAESVSVQTRSRSDKNTAVLGPKEPRQVPNVVNLRKVYTFLQHLENQTVNFAFYNKV